MEASPPYGYKVVDKKLVIDEQQAEVMRFIFDEYANGKSKKDIFDNLEQKGYKTPHGRKFTNTTFQDNLKNTKYIGVYEQFGVKNENYCPAIIDKDTFNKVQKLLKANMNKRAKIDFLLSGKVFCAKCGASVFGVSGTARNGNIHGYYCCSNHQKKHTGDLRYIKKDELEKQIIKQTMENILDEKNIDTIANKILQLCKNDLNAQKLERYQKQIIALDNELNKLTKLIKNAFEIDEDLYNKLVQDFKDTKLQKRDKEQEIQKLKNANVVKHTKESITAFIKQFITDKKYIMESRKIVQDFINTVWIDDTYYIVFYNLM